MVIYAACSSASSRGLEFSRPGRSIAVPVAVVVAEQVVAAGLSTAGDGEGLINGGEEVLGEGGDEGDEGVEVRGGVFRVETAEEVPV